MGRLFARGLASALFCLLSAGLAHGAPLFLTSRPADVTAGFIKATYNSTTQVFDATGTATAFELNGIAPPDYSISAGGSPSKQFKINMTVNPATGAPISGTIVINGTIPTLSPTPAMSGTLLTGNIVGFGFPSSATSNPVFEFLFTATGGDLASYYSSSLLPNGVILTPGTGTGATTFSGGFGPGTDYQNTSSGVSATWPGVADAFFSPEPSAASLALVVISGIGLRVRRK